MGGLNMMGGGFKMMGGFRTILLGLVLLVAEVVGSDNLTGENKHKKLPVSHYVVSESSSVFGLVYCSREDSRNYALVSDEILCTSCIVGKNA